MTELSERILGLRGEGKTYNEIVAELGCAKSTVCYYVSESQKEKALSRQNVRRTSKPRLDNFHYRRPPSEDHIATSHATKLRNQKVTNFQDGTRLFTMDEVRDKFGDNPVCYLTGDKLDYETPSTYSFDHVTPRSKGGANTLENLGLTTREANSLKGDLSVTELLELCKKVLRNYGELS